MTKEEIDRRLREVEGEIDAARASCDSARERLFERGSDESKWRSILSDRGKFLEKLEDRRLQLWNLM